MMPSGSGERTKAVRMAVLRDRVALTVRSSVTMHEWAEAWLASGAQVTVTMYAKRYGVDRYTAREDLEAIGFVFAPGDTRWSVRPEPISRTPRVGTGTGQDPETCMRG